MSTSTIFSILQFAGSEFYAAVHLQLLLLAYLRTYLPG